MPQRGPRAAGVRVSIKCALVALTLFILAATATGTFLATVFFTQDALEFYGAAVARDELLAAEAHLESVYDTMNTIVITLRNGLHTASSKLPQDTPDPFATLEALVPDLMAPAMMRGSPELSLASIVFEGGDQLIISKTTRPGVADIHGTYASDFTNATVRCCGRAFRRAMNLTSGALSPSVESIDVWSKTNGLSEEYYEGKALFLAQASGAPAWETFATPPVPGYYSQAAIITTTGVPLFNASSTFLGIGSIQVDDVVFQQTLRLALSSYVEAAFMINSAGHVVASTRDVDSPELRLDIEDIHGPLPAGCMASADYASAIATRRVVCRPAANDSTYVPLRELSQAGRLESPNRELHSTSNIATWETFNGGLVAAVARLAVQHSPSGLVLVVFARDDKVQQMSSQTTVLSIIAAASVIAVTLLLVASVAYLALAPIAPIIVSMRSTARFTGRGFKSDEADRGDRSRLREVYDLQAAHREVMSIVRGFTAYIPRDILRSYGGASGAHGLAPVACAIVSGAVEGFTLTCQRQSKDDVTDTVRKVLREVLRIVHRTGGSLVGFSGDTFLAAWGAPRPIPNPEVRSALCAALLVRSANVDPLFSVFDALGEAAFVHCGVSAGAAMAGMTGTAKRMAFSITGDVVARAQRLRQRATNLDTKALVGEQVHLRLAHIFVERLIVVAVPPSVTRPQTAIDDSGVIGSALLPPFDFEGPIRVARLYELVGLVQTPSPDVLLRLRMEDEAAQGAWAHGGSSDGESDEEFDDDGLVFDAPSVASAGRFKGGRSSSVKVLDGCYGLTEDALEVPRGEASAVKAFGRIGAAVCRGQFATALRRGKRLRRQLPDIDTLHPQLEYVLSLAQHALDRTRSAALLGHRTFGSGGRSKRHSSTASSDQPLMDGGLGLFS